jgi:hypothetical protein
LPTEVRRSMTELTKNLAIAQTIALIESYAFDLGKYSTNTLIEEWLSLYNSHWIRLATIEALYLGRYKSISIEQILSVWLRLGNPNTHFTHEFERLICRKLPRHLMDLTNFSSVVRFETEEREFSTISNFEAKISDKLPAEKLQPQLATVGSNSIAPKAKMDLISALRVPYQADWSRFTDEQTSIHQFIPLPDVSSFFNKLKAFAKSSES